MEMLIRTERYSGEDGSVAMTPSFRLLCVVMTVPIGLIWNGATGVPFLKFHRMLSRGMVLCFGW